MASISLEIVTAERNVFADEVDMVVAPTVDGVVGILPHHAPMVSVLKAGELKLRRGGEDELLAIAGGFLQVRPDKVIILADAAERAEEIDMARAEEARDRAEQIIEARTEENLEEASAALRRAYVRIHVAQRAHRRAVRQSADSGRASLHE